MKPRQFIDETIDALFHQFENIDNLWKKFKDGKLSRDEFEYAYSSYISTLINEIEEEVNTPNNGCKYSDTNPDNEYFKKSGY